MRERTATFETEDGPKTFTADELEFSSGCDEFAVSKKGAHWFNTTDSPADFVRKIYGLHCTEPGDERVGDIMSAVKDYETPRRRLFVSVGNSEYGSRLKDHNGCELSRLGGIGSILAAIASLTNPETTRDEVFSALVAEIRNRRRGLSAETQCMEVMRLDTLIARAEKLQEDSKTKGDRA